MGLMFSIVSRFRKRATTKEVLEGIEEDIKRLESTLERNQRLQKKTVLSLLSFSVLAYGIAVAIFYFFLLPDNWSERAIWLLPFISFPVLVYFLKKVFHFFFVTRIKKIRRALEELTERKRKILEDVTENETYKIAKELLEKYDPHGKIIQREFAVKPIVEVEKKSPDHGELRQRLNATGPQGANGKLSTPKASSSPAMLPGQLPMPFRPNMSPRFQSPAASNGNGFPRAFSNRGLPQQRPNLKQYPILPRERSFFDQVAEYFVGDGPSYRFALICKACFAHNGMALKDEFEYIDFRCCYCGSPNAARKKRLNAPTLEEEVRSSGRQEADKETPDSVTENKDERKKEEEENELSDEKETDKKENNTSNETEKQDENSKETEETSKDTKETSNVEES